MSSGAPTMSSYEAERWQELQAFWEKKAQRRELPPKAKRAVSATTGKVKDAAATTGTFVTDHTPQTIKNAGQAMADAALVPTVNGVVGLLDWVTDTVQEFSNPASVLDHHRSHGHNVSTVADLRDLDLESLDPVTRRMPWRFSTIGLAEGGAMGGLAMVPVAGTATAIGADLLVMHALSTAVASRAAYAYGIDPTSDTERDHLDRMLRKAWAAQVPKARGVNEARHAFAHGVKRVKWSEKFRHDHRIAAAVERLMKQMNGVDHVPIGKVATKMPIIGVVTSAGTNSALLGTFARNTIRYSQTIHLARKHDLTLPSNLR